MIEQNGRGELPEDDYPFQLSTGRMLQHFHTGTMSRRSSGLDKLTPEAGLEMNQEDMRRLSVTNGEMVRIITKRGSVEVMVKQSNMPPEGVVFLPFHFVEAPANRLTSGSTDPASKTPAFKMSGSQATTCGDCEALIVR